MFQTLYRKIFATRRFLHTRSKIQTAQEQRGRVEWVIARNLCHYRQFLLQEVPLQHRANILNQQIRQWSPFKQYGSYIVWRKQVALVWVWDAQQQQTKLTEHDLTEQRVDIIPETLLHPMGQDSEQLHQCLEGVEGQIWQQQCLVASRWWPQQPTLAQWNRFLSAHHLPNVASLPMIQSDELMQQVWAKSAKTDRSAILRDERLWVFLGLMIFTVLFSWQSVYVWKLRQAIADVNTQIETINDEAIPILQARNEVLALQQKIQHFNNLVTTPSQLEMMAKAAGSLPQGATLQTWSYQKQQLKLTLEAMNIDPRYYITKFQEQPLFYDVRSETGGDATHIIMSMQVHLVQVD